MQLKIIANIFLLGLFTFTNIFAQSNRPINLRCEYKINPKGISTYKPRLSWQLPAIDSDRGVMQVAYQIQVSTDPNNFENKKNITWDSGKQLSDQSTQVHYIGTRPESRNQFFWRVKTWDNQRGESSWSEIANWEMGLLGVMDWTARWIQPLLKEEEKKLNPAPMLRYDFNLKNKIVKARLYITSHGVYEAFLNGQRVGEEIFTPGWTSYLKRLQYQTYDVTELLKTGANGVGVRLGDGWFRGQFGFEDKWNYYGTQLALLFQLEVTYQNGETETIASNKNWKTSTGAIRYSSIYDGELYNARLEKTGWTRAGYDDSDWQGVEQILLSKSQLVGTEGVPIKKMEEVKPKKIFRTPKNELVVDLGQNMVGWIRLKVKGKSGDKITLHHAEVLDKEGNFYTANLRSADQVVQYILKDDQQRTFEPHFTFQGFRYVMLVGYPGELSLDDITGIAIYSEMEKTGNFECSDPLINQLQSNIEWGQKGNFLDVPTDCPQRDERMGWTGDAQAFASTACFNFNTASFYTKWLQDMTADQLPNGSVPFVIPQVLSDREHGSTGWSDAVTIVPWTVYLKYGDEKILKRQYQSMKKWVGYLKDLSEGNFLVQKGFHFGDWLFFIHPTDWNAKPGHTDIDFLATAFFAYSTKLTLQTAKVLKAEPDIKYYSELLSNILKAFQNEFVTPSGRLSSHSQTAYTLALAFELLNEKQKEKAVEYLVKDIKARDYHLSTGFLGTPHLCHVLSENGHLDVAYKLLFQKTYPSWLYPITRGATTIWERWDGIKPDSSFQNTLMNSFNHYAYGAIGDWMYRVVAGIEVDPERPGYKHIIIQPHPTKELSFAKANYQSLYGQISSGWKWKDGSLEIEIQIPPNTTATVILPNAKVEEVKESNNVLSNVIGVTDVKQEEHGVMMEVGSGNYTFRYSLPGK